MADKSPVSSGAGFDSGAKRDGRRPQAQPPVRTEPARPTMPGASAGPAPSAWIDDAPRAPDQPKARLVSRLGMIAL